MSTMVVPRFFNSWFDMYHYDLQLVRVWRSNCARLPPWRLGGFGDFWIKNSSFRLSYQSPSSSADCTRELFKGSNGLASLVDCTRIKFFCWGCGFFLTDVTSEVVLGSFWLIFAWPGAQPLGQSVSLKFSLETRLESESFEPLIDFLAFLVQKLWSKINKLIN